MIMAFVWALIMVGLTVYLALFMAELSSVMNNVSITGFTSYITIETSSGPETYSMAGETLTPNQVVQMLSSGTYTISSTNSESVVITLSTADIAYGYSQLAQLSQTQFPLIGFSTWNFIPVSATISSQTLWTNWWTSTNTLYAYMFLAVIVGYIALVLYVVVIDQAIMKDRSTRKMGLTGAYPSFLNNYKMFNSKAYLEFIVIITAFFAFFSLVSTFIFIAYIIFIFSFYSIAEKKNKDVDPNLMVFKKKDIKYFYYLIGIMILQQGYTIISTLLLNYYNVNISLVLGVIFSIGTLAVVVAGFIKSILSTTITVVSKGMKAMPAQITGFRIFYNIHEQDSLEDYSFMQQTPLWIKNPLAARQIDMKEANKRLKLLDDTTNLYQNASINNNDKKYMLYRLYNQIATVEEVQDTIENIKRTNAYYEAHPKKKLKLNLKKVF